MTHASGGNGKRRQLILPYGSGGATGPHESGCVAHFSHLCANGVCVDEKEGRDDRRPVMLILSPVT